MLVNAAGPFWPGRGPRRSEPRQHAAAAWSRLIAARPEESGCRQRRRVTFAAPTSSATDPKRGPDGGGFDSRVSDAI